VPRRAVAAVQKGSSLTCCKAQVIGTRAPLLSIEPRIGCLLSPCRVVIGWQLVHALGRADSPIVYAGVHTPIKKGLPPPPIMGRGKNKRSVPLAAIVVGVGGLIAFAAVAGAVFLLVKRNKGNINGKVASPSQSQPCSSPPSLDNAGQNGFDLGNGLFVQPKDFVTSDSLSSYGRAPADTVSVTYISSEHRHVVTTWTGFNCLASSDVSKLNASSSPADILNAQLDYITEARGGMLSRFVKYATLLALLLQAWISSESVWLPAGPCV
jgi:hypothetical protein